MKFPEKHTCHPDMRIAKGEWRPSEANFPYRSCDYCGSMHPEDLLAAVERGARLDGADWKYGWPHKFYVTGGGIPHGKFYNVHLLDDLDDEARAKVIDVLWRHTGVRFGLVAGELHFDARWPHPEAAPHAEMAS